VVDAKVITRELVLRNAERDCAEGGTGIPLCTSIRRIMLVALSSSRLTRGYLRIRYDNFMFIEIYSYIRICRIRDLEESARNTIENCPIPSFKGMLTGALGGYKPKCCGLDSR
jgi:hypothetical protein